MTDKMLTPKQAADYLGTSPEVLAVWRSKSPDKVPFTKEGTRVYYAQADLDRVKPTLKRGHGGKRRSREADHAR